MYLGIDLGTSSVKALLIDGDQNVVASASSNEIPIHRPHPGWSEQEPADWVSACEAVLAVLARDNGPAMAAVRGIGLSGHMHGATLIDSSDNPIRRCILWNDTRSHVEAATLDAQPEFRARTGNIVFPGFTAPKLFWVQNNEPQHFSKVRYVLLPKDYIRLWLTGEHMSEMSDSAGTSWLDTGRRDWDDSLLAHTGLERRQMPNLVEGTDSAGVLRPELAARFGLSSGIVVAGGAGDNAASACGMGIVGGDGAFVSLGTSGVLFSANDAYRPRPETAVHTFCHALPGKWHQMGVILSATASLNWLADIAGAEPADMVTELGESLLAPGPATFLPYLSGERTPHNDALVRGAFAGLGSGRKEMTQAVLEGVTFALADCRDALQATGTAVNRVTAVGGGSNSPYWRKLVASVLQIPVDVPVQGDFGAALGAARLGMAAATGSDPAGIMTPPPIEQTIEPDLSLTQAFSERLNKYRQFYPAIRSIFP